MKREGSTAALIDAQNPTGDEARKKVQNNRVTTNPDEIRAWAEARGGCPARVKGTSRGPDPGIIRIDFPGFSGFPNLEPITWEEFFEKFEEKELALLIQEETAHGQRSRFNRLVKRASLEPGRGRMAEQRSAGSSQSTDGSASHW